MNESINKEATTSYEPLDVRAMATKPESYEEIQLPPQTGQDHDYYNVDDYLTPVEYRSYMNN